MSGMKRRLADQEERTRVAIALGDLDGSGIDILCQCNRCGHCAVVPTATLTHRLGPALPVPDVGARMRCTGCGARDVVTSPAWPTADRPWFPPA